MCGLFGILNLDGRPVDLDEALGMLGLVAHRGPDGTGYHHEGPAFLGHRRLSIIDVEGGAQPIYNEDRTLVIIGNGEIYNHLDLRRGLEKRGHRFTTLSDTEVLLHLYEEEREGFLERLNGMFAFAILDTRDRTLFLARDRIGIKPLYYHSNPKQFVFSSEIKAIALSGLVPLEIDERVVYQYLTLHHSIPPNTLLEGIVALRPGHFLFVGKGPVEQREWWDIRSNIGEAKLSWDEAYERAESLLRDSVEKRLMVTFRSVSF